jgi:hypothetical protein
VVYYCSAAYNVAVVGKFGALRTWYSLFMRSLQTAGAASAESFNASLVISFRVADTTRIDRFLKARGCIETTARFESPSSAVAGSSELIQ